MNSGKCPHDHLIVHGDGAWFTATCKGCGITGPQGDSPAEARALFDKRKGKRPYQPNPVWLRKQAVGT